MKDAGIPANKIDEVVLVGGMTRMPAIQEKVQNLFAKEAHQGVNPDEVVAIGAAIQGGILQGDIQDLLLLDVTPLTLGIETLGGVTTSLIPRNTTIPTAKTETFSTAADNQTSVEVHVLQGERTMSTENKTIGRFMLDGIVPAARGVPQIEVTFDIDANGILNVSAKDKGTGKEQKITITASSGISEDEIEKMVNEAEQHAEDDKEKREAIELKNNAENIAYSAEKLIADNADKIEESDKTQLEEDIKSLRDVLADDSSENSQIQEKIDALQTSMQNIGGKIYAAQQENSETPTDSESEENSESKNDDDDTVEGEFKEV